jgi:hypothetical protein
MSEPLRELFLKAFAEFDFKGFDEANKKTDALSKNLKGVGEATKVPAKASVNLSGNLKILESSMSSAGVSTGALSSAIAFLSNPITAMIAVLTAAVLGFVAYIGVLKKTLSFIYEFSTSMAETGGKISALSKRLGISAQALNSWSQAAKEADVSVSSLEMAITDLSTKIGKATIEPTSKAAKELKRYGFNINELKNLRPEQVFERVTDAIAAQTDPAQRLAMANALLGNSGRELIPLLEKGSGNLQKYRAQLDRAQPGLTKFLELSEELGEQQNKLNEAWEGTKQILFNAVAPAVTWFLEKLAQLVTWYNNSQQAQDAFKIGIIALFGAVTALAAPFISLAATITLMLIPVLIAISPIILGVAAAFTFAALAVQDFYVFLQGGESVFELFLGYLYDIPNALRQIVATLISTDSPIGKFISLVDSATSTVISLYNAFAKITNLPTIDPGSISIRRTIQDTIGSPRNERDQAINRAMFVEQARMTVSSALGVEQTVPMGDRISRHIASLPGSPTPSSLVTPSTASSGPSQINNQIEQRTQITVNEATDGARTRQMIDDALSRQNRDLVDVLSSR